MSKLSKNTIPTPKCFSGELFHLGENHVINSFHYIGYMPVSINLDGNVQNLHYTRKYQKDSSNSIILTEFYEKGRKYFIFCGELFESRQQGYYLCRFWSQGKNCRNEHCRGSHPSRAANLTKMQKAHRKDIPSKDCDKTCTKDTKKVSQYKPFYFNQVSRLIQIMKEDIPMISSLFDSAKEKILTFLKSNLLWIQILLSSAEKSENHILPHRYLESFDGDDNVYINIFIMYYYIMNFVKHTYQHGISPMVMPIIRRYTSDKKEDIEEIFAKFLEILPISWSGKFGDFVVTEVMLRELIRRTLHCKNSKNCTGGINCRHGYHTRMRNSTKTPIPESHFFDFSIRNNECYFEVSYLEFPKETCVLSLDSVKVDHRLKSPQPRLQMAKPQLQQSRTKTKSSKQNAKLLKPVPSTETSKSQSIVPSKPIPQVKYTLPNLLSAENYLEQLHGSKWGKMKETTRTKQIKKLISILESSDHVNAIAKLLRNLDTGFFGGSRKWANREYLRISDSPDEYIRLLKASKLSDEDQEKLEIYKSANQDAEKKYNGMIRVNFVKLVMRSLECTLGKDSVLYRNSYGCLIVQTIPNIMDSLTKKFGSKRLPNAKFGRTGGSTKKASDELSSLVSHLYSLYMGIKGDKPSQFYSWLLEMKMVHRTEGNPPLSTDLVYAIEDINSSKVSIILLTKWNALTMEKRPSLVEYCSEPNSWDIIASAPKEIQCLYDGDIKSLKEFYELYYKILPPDVCLVKTYEMFKAEEEIPIVHRVTSANRTTDKRMKISDSQFDALVSKLLETYDSSDSSTIDDIDDILVNNGGEWFTAGDFYTSVRVLLNASNRMRTVPYKLLKNLSSTTFRIPSLGANALGDSGFWISEAINNSCIHNKQKWKDNIKPLYGLSTQRKIDQMNSVLQKLDQIMCDSSAFDDTESKASDFESDEELVFPNHNSSTILESLDYKESEDNEESEESEESEGSGVKKQQLPFKVDGLLLSYRKLFKYVSNVLKYGIDISVENTDDKSTKNKKSHKSKVKKGKKSGSCQRLKLISDEINNVQDRKFFSLLLSAYFNRDFELDVSNEIILKDKKKTDVTLENLEEFITALNTGNLNLDIESISTKLFWFTRRDLQLTEKAVSVYLNKILQNKIRIFVKCEDDKAELLKFQPELYSKHDKTLLLELSNKCFQKTIQLIMLKYYKDDFGVEVTDTDIVVKIARKRRDRNLLRKKLLGDLISEDKTDADSVDSDPSENSDEFTSIQKFFDHLYDNTLNFTKKDIDCISRSIYNELFDLVEKWERKEKDQIKTEKKEKKKSKKRCNAGAGV